MQGSGERQRRAGQRREPGRAAGRLPPRCWDPAAASGHPKDGKKSCSPKPVLLMGINLVGQGF